MFRKKMIKKNFNSNYLIISFSKDFYKFHYTLTLASSLRAIDKNVTVFISGYACNFIKKKWQSNDEQNIHKKLEQKNMGSIEEIFLYCKELEVKIFYCICARWSKYLWKNYIGISLSILIYIFHETVLLDV